jgi:hypothetical protein
MGGSEIDASGASDTSESEAPPVPKKRSGKGKKAAARSADHPRCGRFRVWAVLKMGAELEASEVWAIQGKRIRVLLSATLPKPES